MTNVVDYSGDHRFWSQTEAVTVHASRTLPQGAETLALHVAIAKRDSARYSAPVVGGTGLAATQETWWLPVGLLAGYEPRRDDAIEDAAGVRYRIDSARLVRVGASASHWDCECTVERRASDA